MEKHRETQYGLNAGAFASNAMPNIEKNLNKIGRMVGYAWNGLCGIAQWTLHMLPVQISSHGRKYHGRHGSNITTLTFISFFPEHTLAKSQRVWG